MELRQLRFAVRLADVRHFGRAAELEHIAPSVFSTTIKQLETELGVMLFNRTSRQVEITPAGEHFVSEARVTLDRLELLRQESLAIARQHEARLRIGFFGEGFGLANMLIDAFVIAHPRVEVSFVELTMRTQLVALLHGDVDVALLRLPIDDERLAVLPLLAEPRFAAVPASDERADAESLRMEDLLDAPFAIAADGAPPHWGSYWSLDEQRGESSRVGAVVNTLPESITAIAYAKAFDTYPSSAIETYAHPGVRFVPLVDAPPSELGLVHRRDNHNPTIGRFTTVVRDVVRLHLDAFPNARSLLADE